MSLRTQYDFDLLKNIMEDIVIVELETQLKLPEYKDVCKCQACILDIIAITLNKVQPMYGSLHSFKGTMYKEHISEKSNAEIVSALKEAIEKVVKEPNCAK